jgi:hypothetical protein
MVSVLVETACQSQSGSIRTSALFGGLAQQHITQQGTDAAMKQMIHPKKQN